jgi:peptidoglycan/LPS O-acetylase OafA/YrhL
VPERRVSPLLAAFLGALLGALIACMAKGAQLGWDDGKSEWSWLSALFGMLGGPLLLFLDGLTVFGKGAPGSALVALPWAGIGAAIGAVAGLLSHKEQ